MTRTTSIALLVLLLAAGCDAGAAPAPSASASSDRHQLLALGQEWVDCLRGKGLTRMPDAELTQDGYLQFPPAQGYDWKHDLATHKDIIEACKSIEDRYPPNAFRPKETYSAADLRKLAQYAECVRQHGIPDFPDPNAAGQFDVSGTPLANGIPGALQDQADAACHHIWSGSVKVTGGSAVKK
nr:hypothetical protein [uncultured Actinoplanes sp.]